MNLSKSQAAIIDGCRVAIVITNGPDGQPNASATWFEREDDRIRVSVAEFGVKARNSSRDHRVTLFFIDPDTSLRTVELRCIVEVEPDPDMATAKRIGGRMGDDLTNYVAEGEGRITLVCRPQHIVEFSAV